MRKAVLMLLILMLLTTTGCENPYKPYLFNDQVDLIKMTGNSMLYPDTLPFETTFNMFTGFHHTSTRAWDYIIDLRSYDPTNADMGFDEMVSRVNEGFPEVISFDVTALEMDNRARGRLVPDKKGDMEAYEAFADSGADKWSIGGVTVTYRSNFGADFISSADPGSTTDYIVFLTLNTYAAFMYDGVLYMINMRVIGHRNETVEELFKTVDMLKEIITGMIG